MKLYLVTRTDRIGYDHFDSQVVAAFDENDARSIIPNGDSGSWTRNPSSLEVIQIGRPSEGVERGTVLSSFNAG